MRISHCIVALSSLLLLANCSGTMHSTSSKKPPFREAVDGYYKTPKGGVLKPPGLEKALAPEPVQEAGLTAEEITLQQQSVPSFASEPMMSAPEPEMAAVEAPEESHQPWYSMGGEYNTEDPALPPEGVEAKAAPVKLISVPVIYADVSVYPVDGDVEPYSDLKYTDIQVVDGDSPEGAAAIAAAGMPTAGDVIAAAAAGEDVNPVGEAKRQVFFDYGSSKVQSKDHQALAKMAKELIQTAEEYKVNVIGHASKRVDHVTDPVRKKIINYEMGQKRANAVARELYSAGIESSWVVSASKGDQVPNPNPGSRTQEAADRRVDVFVEGGKQKPVAGNYLQIPTSK